MGVLAGTSLDRLVCANLGCSEVLFLAERRDLTTDFVTVCVDVDCVVLDIRDDSHCFSLFHNLIIHFVSFFWVIRPKLLFCGYFEFLLGDVFNYIVPVSEDILLGHILVVELTILAITG